MTSAKQHATSPSCFIPKTDRFQSVFRHIMFLLALMVTYDESYILNVVAYTQVSTKIFRSSYTGTSAVNQFQHQLVSNPIIRSGQTSYQYIGKNAVRRKCEVFAISPIGDLSNEEIEYGNFTVNNHNNRRTAVATGRKKIVTIFAVLSVIFSFLKVIELSGPNSWRYYLAGGICAASSHSIPTPIDVVKTRKQVDPDLQGKGFLQVAREIVEKEGVRSLFVGLGPTTIGYLIEGAIKFGLYEAFKPMIKGIIKSQIIGFCVCASIAGTASSLFLCPMEALRIRLVSEPNFAPKGWVQGGYKMLRDEGVSSLWKGAGPMILKQVPYTVTKNVSFDTLTRYAYWFVHAQGIAITKSTTFAIPFLAASIASVLSCISSQPGDMLLTLVNAHKGDKSVRDFTKDVIKSEKGIGGFFVGMSDRMLHVGGVVTIQLLIYDFMKRLCGIAATGSA